MLRLLRTSLLLGLAVLLGVLLPLPSNADELFDARGFVQNRAYFGQSPVEHIDPVTGNVLLTFTDLVLPGNAGFDLRIQRTYNSKVYRNYHSQGETLDEDSWAGVGWTLHLGRVLQPFSVRPVIEMPDGSRHPLFSNADRAGCVTPAGTCLITREFWVYEPPELRLPSGITYTFGHSANVGGVDDLALYATEVRDPFGNRITATYMETGTTPALPSDGIAQIDQELVGGQTRTVEFTTSTRVNSTPSGDVPLKDLSAMILKINGLEEARWTFVQGIANGGYTLLTEVVPPEGNPTTTWKYAYSTTSPKYLLVKATTPDQGEFAYAYAPATLYSGTTVGVRSIVVYWRNLWDFFSNSTVYYRYPGFNEDQPVPPDARVISGPCGQTTYTYWGLGPNTAGVPAWKIGTLRSRTVADSATAPALEREDIEYWDPPLARISNDTETVGNQTTSGIYVPLRKRQTITRQGKSYVQDYAYRSTDLNDFGRPSSIVETGELIRITNFTYRYGFAPYIVDRVASEVVSVGSESFTKTYDYDLASGFVTSRSIFGVPTTYTPTPGGNTETETDANGNTTRYTYDWGVMKEVFTPEYTSATLSRQINPGGTVASETRFQNGVPFTTSFVYDRLFRITETRPPLGNPVLTTYDNLLESPGSTPPVRIFTLTTRGASELREIHDGVGRTEHRINAVGDQTDIDYDVCGRQSYQSDPFQGDITGPENVGSQFTYDALGRLLRKTNTADGSSVQYSYQDGVDADITDENGKTTHQDWSAFGDPAEARLMRVVDAANQATTYSYNAIGSLLGVDQAGGQPRRWVYDTKNRLISETHPESGTVLYQYDAAGNLREKRDAKFGSTAPTVYCYDRNNRLIRVALPGTQAGSTCTTYDKSLSYDESNNRTSTSRGADESLFQYDGANRLVGRTDLIGGRRFTMTFAYDTNDNLRDLGYPLGQGLPESARHHAEFEHDSADRISRVWWSADGVRQAVADQMLYHPSGGLKSYNWGGGLAQRTDIGYDRRSRVNAVNAAAVLNLGYGYDNVGNVTSITDGRGAGFGSSFGYDSVHRLETAVGPWGSGRFGYDGLGNRLSTSVGGTTFYSYDSGTGRLQSTSGSQVQSFGYDANGNITSDMLGIHTYTPENMLATSVVGGTTTGYSYDADNLRTLKVAVDGSYYYFHDAAGQVLAEMLQVGTADPRLLHEYVFAGQRLLAAVRPGGLRVAPSSLVFAAVKDGSTSGPQTLSIQSETAASLEWQASSSTPWLVLSPAGGGTPASLIASVDSSRVGAPGTYDAWITVTAQQGGAPVPGSPMTIAVRLVVTASSRLTAAPAALSFTMENGGGIPIAQPLDVVLSGSSVPWQAQASAAWMHLSPASGQTPGRLIVSVEPQGLGEGTYRGSITITSAGVVGSPVIVPVTLIVPARLGICAVDAFYCEPFDELGPGDLSGQGGWVVIADRQSGQVSADPRGFGQVLVIDPPPGGVSGDSLNLPERPIGGLEFSLQVMSQGVDPDTKQVAKIEFMTQTGVAWGKTFRTFGAIRWGSALYVQYGANVYHRLLDTLEPNRWYEVKVRYNNGAITAFVDGVPLFSTSNPLAEIYPFQTFATSGWDFPGSAALDVLQVRPVSASLPPQLLVQPLNLTFSGTAASSGLAAVSAPSAIRFANASGTTSRLFADRTVARSSPPSDVPLDRRPPSSPGGHSDAAGAAELWGALPLAFEPNRGQVSSDVQFLARAKGHRFYFGAGGVVVVPPTDGRAPHEGVADARIPLAGRSAASATSPLRIAFKGARRDITVVGGEPLPGRSHYFLGRDPKDWHTDVPQFARITYGEAFPGVDFTFYGRPSGLEYDIVVKPGADINAVRLVFEGSEDLAVDADGALIIRGPGRELRQLPPMIYQEASGRRSIVAGRYSVVGRNEVGFAVGEYDRSRPLVLDPVLVYATYFGGTDRDDILAIAVDADGSAYLAGDTISNDLPTLNAFQPTRPSCGSSDPFQCVDAFVAKLNSTGTALLYSTYLGGDVADIANGIAVDASGNAYVSGTTDSSNFPRLNGVVTPSGGRDAFIAKINPQGSGLVYSTVLGGSGEDNGGGVAIDSSRNVYVAGYTASDNFPTRNPVQATRRGGFDLFVTKIDSMGSAIVYSTYLGGSQGEVTSAHGGGGWLVVDPAGQAYVAGYTSSADFPVVNAFQSTVAGGNDVVVAKLNAAGSALVYSTYLGGSDNDSSPSLALDDAGSLYVVGVTRSANFPMVGALEPAFPPVCPDTGCTAGFVAKLAATGSGLAYSTYLNEASGSWGLSGVAIDPNGNMCLAGEALESNTPVPFLAKLDALGLTLKYATTIMEGGAAWATAADAFGNCYFGGIAQGNGMATIAAGGPPLKPSYSGLGFDGIVVAINDADALAGQFQFSAATYTANENGSRVDLTVRRVGGTSGEAFVDFSTANGTAIGGIDYVSSMGTVAFADGEDVATISVPLMDDNIYEDTETFTVTLSNPAGGMWPGSPRTATVSIIDDDVAGDRLTQTFSISDANGSTNMAWTASEALPWLTLSATSGTGPSTVTATVDPTAAVAGNYTGTITVAAEADNSPQTIQVNLSLAIPPPVTLNPVADAYVRDGTSKTTNFGGATTLDVRTGTKNGDSRDAYLKFDLTSMANVKTAKLRIFAALSAAGTIGTSVYSVANTTWTESGITWNTKPPLGAALASTNVTSTTYGWYELDVTNYVKGEFAAGRKVMSFAYHDPATSTANISIKSRENAANKPELVIAP